MWSEGLWGWKLSGIVNVQVKGGIFSLFLLLFEIFLKSSFPTFYCSFVHFQNRCTSHLSITSMFEKRLWNRYIFFETIVTMGGLNTQTLLLLAYSHYWYFSLPSLPLLCHIHVYCHHWIQISIAAAATFRSLSHPHILWSWFQWS